MRKVLHFATALTVAMTSFSSIVATAADETAFGTPEKDKAAVTLDISTSWNGGVYADHETEAKAQSVDMNKTTEFDSKATLDMQYVAEKWHEFKEKPRAKKYAENHSADEHALAKAVTLEGEYTLTITRSDSAIANDKIVKDGTLQDDFISALKWEKNEAGYSVDDFFDYVPAKATLSGDKNTLTVVYKVKEKTEELNVKFDEYFEGLAAADADSKSKYDFILKIDDSTITPTTAGTYSVKGTFRGDVTITYGDYHISTVYFPEEDTTKVTEDIEYMKADESAPTPTPYVSRRGGGGGGAVRATATPQVTEAPQTTETPGGVPTPVPGDKIQTVTNDRGASLNTDDHYAYIIGYPLEEDETLAEVRPQAGITRAEVATIFFRLLRDESRTRFWTTDNTFSDVEKAEWYNNAISTAQNAGIIEGSEGKFRPNDPITRAEFATIAARFSSVVYNGDDKFSDIGSHWARNNINKAAETGWVQGYEDGTFRPDNKITRAEAMTLVNRMLYRIVAVSGLEEDGMLTWIDNLDKSAWYYAAVQEATNSHDYSRVAIGYSEDWTRTKAPRDWEALEKTYSNPDSAGKEDSVFEDSGLNELDKEQADTERPAVEADAEATEAPDAEATEAPEATEEPAK